MLLHDIARPVLETSALTTVGLIALTMSYVLVAAYRCWAVRWRIMDLPNERSSHVVPVPRGAGIVIACLTLGMYSAWTYWSVSGAPPIPFLAYLAGATMVVAVSWLDDRHSVPPVVRLLVHLGCAILVVGGAAAEVGTQGMLMQRTWLSVGVAAVWVTGLTNAYNFMDGIDGIAALQAVISGAAWCFLGQITGHDATAVLGLLLAMTNLGFLGHNWSPARVFMGDVGSAFLGFSFGTLAVWGAQSGWRPFAAGMLFVWPFLMDTGFTLLRRAWKRENLMAAHRSHLYQRLVIAQRSHQWVATLYGLLALTGAIAGGLVWLDAPWADVGAPLVVVLLGSGLWLAVHRHEQRQGAQTACHGVVE